MKRTTILIDETIERELKAIARREKSTVSALVREAIGTYVAQRKSQSTLPSFVGLGRSGRADTASLHEELLFRDKGEETGTSPSKAKRPRSPSRRTPKATNRG